MAVTESNRMERMRIGRSCWRIENETFDTVHQGGAPPQPAVGEDAEFLSCYRVYCREDLYGCLVHGYEEADGLPRSPLCGWP
ncbi:MAG: hypothetical protein OXG56_10900 [Gammaproteobacteria bacterium]|nr:hypothetical protein [Gammaproteobacteria bacterium]